MLQGIENIFADREEMLQSLKKQSYETRMRDFLAEHGHYFVEMKEYVDQAEDGEKAAIEIGECIAHAAGTCKNKKGKLDAKTKSQLNLFMVYYVFPAILKQGEGSKVLADGVLKVWRTVFKNKEMQYTDYETLYHGFREKIFGIFG